MIKCWVLGHSGEEKRQYVKGSPSMYVWTCRRCGKLVARFNSLGFHQGLLVRRGTVVELESKKRVLSYE